MSSKSSKVMNIEDLSRYLKIPKSTLYKVVRTGSIPSQKIGRHLRFHQEAIDEWLKGQNVKKAKDE